MDETTSMAWQEPHPPIGMPIPVKIGATQRTPVFSTMEPNPGLAAALRRVAYGYPTHRTQHWLLLLAADRVESGGNLVRELVTPGQQRHVWRHYARQFRANRTGFAVVGLALASAFLLSRARRGVSRNGAY